MCWIKQNVKIVLVYCVIWQNSISQNENNIILSYSLPILYLFTPYLDWSNSGKWQIFIFIKIFIISFIQGFLSKQVWIKSKYKHLINNFLLFSYRLGNGLWTLNTLSMVTDHLNYRVSIYLCSTLCFWNSNPFFWIKLIW